MMKQKFIDFKTTMKTKIHRLNLVRDRNTEKYKHLNMLIMLIFPIFISCMAEINQAKYVSSFIKFLSERPSVMLFNFIVASLIFYMLLAIVKKGWLAMLVHGTIYMLLSTVELFKYGTNGNHLILSDMKLFKSVKSLTSFAYIKITPRLIIYYLIAISFIALAFYLNPKMKMKPIKRCITAGFCALPCVSLIVIPSFSTSVYSIFDVDTTSASNTFLLNEKFESNSLLAFLVETASESFENRLIEPDSYSEESIDDILESEKVQSGDFNGGKKPNVIVIMSESYADFRAFDELNVDDKYYEKFDEACSEGHSGTLIAPTYASFTVRSEFELLFGLPVRSLNDPNMPQRLLAEREQPSMAQYYKDWGYNTAYIHPFTGSFYSRQRVYSQFGFDQMIFDEDFTVPVERYGTYIDDSTVFNQIESLLSESNAPMYIHTTTMQNHQPYDQGENPDAEFENYLQWVQHTNEGLSDFLGKLEQLEEPTLVFMVGDHFPSLKGGSGVYEQLGINGQNCSVIYEQKYLLWSNYDADFSTVPDEKFSFFYVPYMLMNIIDAPRDEFIQKMNEYLEEIPVYSTNYNDSAEHNEELDMLTYDRVIGDLISSNPIPEEKFVSEENEN